MTEQNTPMLSLDMAAPEAPAAEPVKSIQEPAPVPAEEKAPVRLDQSQLTEATSLNITTQHST